MANHISCWICKGPKKRFNFDKNNHYTGNRYKSRALCDSCFDEMAHYKELIGTPLKHKIRRFREIKPLMIAKLHRERQFMRYEVPEGLESDYESVIL